MRGGLIQQFQRHSVKLARAVAIHESARGSAPATQVTWCALAASTARLAATWRDRLKPGDVLLLALPSGSPFYAAFLSGLLADLSVLPVSPELTDAELCEIASHANVAAVVAPRSTCELLADRVSLCVSEEVVTFEDVRADDASLAAAVANCRGTAELWLCSSGSTYVPGRGQPLVRRPMASLDAVASNCVQSIGVTDEDAILLTVPLHHSYGLEHGLLMPMFAGATVHVHGTFDLNDVMRTLCASVITVLPGVPFLYESIAMSWSADTDAAAFGPGRSLRCAYSAGGPLPRAIYEDFRDRFNVRIGQVFGSTEVGSVTYADPHRAYDRTEVADCPTLNVGFPMPGVSIRVLDRYRPDIANPLPAGADGLIAIAAPSMLSDFVTADDGLPDHLNRGLVGGYFLTGDVGHLDDDGALTIEQCAPCLINVGGRKVNPAEVEAVLMAHPAVRCASVSPTPVTATVSRLRASVELHENAVVDVSALRQFCRGRLSAYKVPRQFEIAHNFDLSTARAARSTVPSPSLAQFAVKPSRVVPLLLLVALWLSGCTTLEPLPTHDWPGTDAALAIVSNRAETLQSMSARCDITIDPPDHDSVRIEGAMAAAKPDRFRLQAWKLGQKLIDLTIREDGIWLWTDPRAERVRDTLPTGTSGAHFVTSWLGPLLSPFDTSTVEVLCGEGTRDRLLVVQWPIPPTVGAEPSGFYWRVEIDRPTQTIRSMRVIDPQGATTQTITLDRYRMIGDTPWPTQWRADGKVTMKVRMSEIELNPQLPPAAFKPARQATRRP